MSGQELDAQMDLNPEEIKRKSGFIIPPILINSFRSYFESEKSDV